MDDHIVDLGNTRVLSPRPLHERHTLSPTAVPVRVGRMWLYRMWTCGVNGGAFSREVLVDTRRVVFGLLPDKRGDPGSTPGASHTLGSRGCDSVRAPAANG